MSVSFTSSLPFTDFSRGYSIVMWTMWGIGVDIPRLVVRYGKAYPLSINIHSISMLMIGLFTTMYVIAQITMNGQQYGSSYEGLTGAAYGQFITSIILMCLVLVQFLLGFLTRVQMFSSSLNNSLATLKWLHIILGYAVEILGKVVATLIVSTSVSDLVFRGWLFLLGGLGVTLIVLQIIYRSQSKTIILECLFKSRSRHGKYHSEIYSSLLQKKETFLNYKEKGVRYVIIDNNMYYIDEDFMHPGGEFIFNLLNGKQINYYLKGARSITPHHPRHPHTKFVAKYLENRLVGQIGVEPILLNNKMSSDNIDWRIQETVKTNYLNTYLLTFQTDAGKVRTDLKIEHFGKYLMMGCSTEEILHKTQRPYFLCFSLSNPQVDILDNLRRHYKYYYFGEEGRREEDGAEQGQDEINRLSFFIRDIKTGVFSKFLLNAPKDRIFSLTGPYGRGLNLNEQSKGYYLLLASDMGVVAYVDFLNFLLQKTLYDLIRRKASTPSLQKMQPRGGRYDILNGVRVLFVGSFTNSSQFYLSTVIKQLYYLNLKHGLNNFNMMLHYANAEAEQEIKMVRDTGKQFFANLIEEEQPDKVFYSGSLNLEVALRKAEADFKLKFPIQYL